MTVSKQLKKAEWAHSTPVLRRRCDFLFAYTVPLQPKVPPIWPLFVGDCQCGKEDVSLIGARRNELAQQEEEGRQGVGLEEVDPWVKIHLGLGKAYGYIGVRDVKR